MSVAAVIAVRAGLRAAFVARELAGRVPDALQRSRRAPRAAGPRGARGIATDEESIEPSPIVGERLDAGPPPTGREPAAPRPRGHERTVAVLAPAGRAVVHPRSALARIAATGAHARRPHGRDHRGGGGHADPDREPQDDRARREPLPSARDPQPAASKRAPSSRDEPEAGEQARDRAVRPRIRASTATPASTWPRVAPMVPAARTRAAGPP